MTFQAFVSILSGATGVIAGTLIAVAAVRGVTFDKRTIVWFAAALAMLSAIEILRGVNMLVEAP